MGKKFYLNAPIDEVKLKNEVLSLFPDILKDLITRDQLLEIQKNKSIDHATMALYQSILGQNRFKKFIDLIHNQKITTDRSILKNSKWCLLPAMLYEDHPEVGGGGELILSATCELGFDIKRLSTGGKKGVIYNATILKKWVDENPKVKLGIITTSKGSLEFRYAYHFLFSKEDQERVGYWINLGGFPYGSALADTMLNTLKNKIYVFIARRVIKMDYEVLTETRSDFEAWKIPLSINSNTKVFSFFPLPLTSHVQTSLVSRYKKLSQFGPNDGMAECYKAPYWDGDVYPLWGADHFCRTTEMVMILYKLFSYIKEIEQP